MKKPIFLKLYLSYLLLILAVTGIILAIVFRSFGSHAVETSTDSLKKLGMTLKYMTEPLLQQGRIDDLNASIRRIDADILVRITIIDSKGTVIADSERTAQSLTNHGSRPEVVAALSGKTGSSVRYSTTLKHNMLYVAVPMTSGGTPEAVIRLSVPLKDIDPLLDSVKKHTLELAVSIILTTLLVALVFTQVLSTPFRKLNKASRRLAAGDFSTRVSLKSGDEIEELADGFNEMAEKLDIYFSELTNSKEELQSIISSMGEGLLVIDPEGKVLLTNPSADTLIGSARPAGRYYWELVRSPKLNSLVDEAKQGPLTDRIEIEEKVYLCSITPIRAGRAKIILLHDISGMIRLEKIKKDLVVNVSHELRTPLTAIKGFTETLLDCSSGKDLEYLEIIKRHTDRLINIINDLLDLSELETKEIVLAAEEIRLKTLLEDLLTMFDQRLKSKGLTAGIEGPASDLLIKGDPFRLEQLFINLIDNAVKYTERGGIVITLARSGDNAVVRVSDTGIGIPREHLNRIFERFYVVDKSRSRKLGGTGLGLAIVKHIATLHKGTVIVESRPCEGTTFTLTLPLPA